MEQQHTPERMGIIVTLEAFHNARASERPLLAAVIANRQASHHFSLCCQLPLLAAPRELQAGGRDDTLELLLRERSVCVCGHQRPTFPLLKKQRVPPRVSQKASGSRVTPTGGCRAQAALHSRQLRSQALSFLSLSLFSLELLAVLNMHTHTRRYLFEHRNTTLLERPP